MSNINDSTHGREAEWQDGDGGQRADFRTYDNAPIANTAAQPSGAIQGDRVSAGGGIHEDSLGSDAASGGQDSEPIEKYSFRMTKKELAEVHSGAFRIFYVTLMVAASIISGFFLDNAYSEGNGLFSGWVIMASVYTVIILFLIMLRKGREKQINKGLELDEELLIFDRHVEYSSYREGVLKRFFRVESDAVESVSCTDRLFTFISEGIIYSIPRRVLTKDSRISEVVRMPSINGVVPKNPMLCRNMPTFLIMTVYTLLPVSLINIVAVGGFPLRSLGLPLFRLLYAFCHGLQAEVSRAFF